MKIQHAIMIAAAVLAFIAVMWMEGWRLTPPQQTQPFSEFKGPPNFHFTAPKPH